MSCAKSLVLQAIPRQLGKILQRSSEPNLVISVERRSTEKMNRDYIGKTSSLEELMYPRIH